ncbi:hypothetical protein BAE44_0017612 [Dichanthelium oligosanthes]|uniref:KIB1-4 beta-propeller domain-containing protein n=1 Tax=Dichanthelium oligosanthes TaxID=888268 RepID=A0A1E5V8C2_9POAL|nr:hypothetical protein BAE44_0017612 [Dichanthelium oligosanthes]
MGLLQDHRCFETPQGWVLALDRASLRTFLWRPEDGERIALPDMDVDFPRSCKCVLSDRPGAASFCAMMVLDLDESEYWLCRRQQVGAPWLHVHHVRRRGPARGEAHGPAPWHRRCRRQGLLRVHRERCGV